MSNFFTMTSIVIAVLAFLFIVAIIIILKPSKKVQKNLNIDIVITKLKALLTSKYPNIDIDFNLIKKNATKNSSSYEGFIAVEEILKKFAEFKIDIPINGVPRDELWSNYEEFSFPMKNKIPKDFQKRKLTIYMNNNKRCQRCGTKLKIEDAMVYLIKSLENKGTYHLENLSLLCNDCYKILTTNDLLKIVKSLKIYDEMLNILDK